MPTSDIDYLTIIQSGLPPASARSKKVIIIGAGMAGLVFGGCLLMGIFRFE